MKKALIFLGIALFVSLILVVVFNVGRISTRKIVAPQISPAPFEETALKMEALPGAEVSEEGSPSERLIIKTAELSLLVDDVFGKVASVKDLALEFEGFIASASIYYKDVKKEQPIAELRLRVPEEKFDEALEKLESLATKVKSENIRGEDVTEEYTDLQSRLRNLEATESQLLEVLKKAVKIPDILEVQRELTRVRGQIEQLKGRIQFLERSAKFSAITVHLATAEEELPIVEEGWKPLLIAKRALRLLLRFWRRVGDAVIFGGIFLSPFIVLALIILGWKKFRK